MFLNCGTVATRSSPSLSSDSPRAGASHPAAGICGHLPRELPCRGHIPPRRGVCTSTLRHSQPRNRFPFPSGHRRLAGTVHGQSAIHIMSNAPLSPTTSCSNSKLPELLAPGRAESRSPSADYPTSGELDVARPVYQQAAFQHEEAVRQMDAPKSSHFSMVDHVQRAGRGLSSPAALSPPIIQSSVTSRPSPTTIEVPSTERSLATGHPATNHFRTAKHPLLLGHFP